MKGRVERPPTAGIGEFPLFPSVVSLDSSDLLEVLNMVMKFGLKWSKLGLSAREAWAEAERSRVTVNGLCGSASGAHLLELTYGFCCVAQ